MLTVASNFQGTIKNFIHSVLSNIRQQKALKSRQKELTMLVIFDLNELSIEFLYGFLNMNIEKLRVFIIIKQEK